MEISEEQKRNSAERFGIWFIKIISGLIIIAFLVLHFIINHLVAPEGLLTYADIIQYYSNPIIPIVEVLFLITVVPHALLGLRSIILDLNPALKIIRTLNILFVLFGSSVIIYGIWLVIAIVNRF